MLTGMTDFRGNSLYLGDTIVYTSRQGSSLCLTEGRIVDFGINKADPMYPWMTDRPFIKVKPIRRSYDWRSQKDVRLTHTEYIVKVADELNSAS